MKPQLTPIRQDIPMPERRKRGPRPTYDFDGLIEIGMSFGVVDRSARRMMSVVKHHNRVGKDVRHFSVFDVDPKLDPDGAKCRVFRDV